MDTEKEPEKIVLDNESSLKIGETQKFVVDVDHENKSVSLERIIPGPIMRYKVPKATFVLYYRNVPRDVVMIKMGDYAILRKLEQEIRLVDPGNYLAIHELTPVTENEIPEIVKELFDV